MASYLSLQTALIIGVLAFTCFSQELGANNETTTTPPPTTITTGSLTTLDTTPATNMTTLATTFVTTAATTNVTTTATTNATVTATPNVTTDLTTGLTNFTTETESTGTTPAVTEPTPEAGWAVKDKNGELCMLMNFTGTVTQIFSELTTDIPAYANSTRSECSSMHSSFVLEFKQTELVFNFSKHRYRHSFELRAISVAQSSSSGSYSSSALAYFFSVPLGDYYSCNYFNYTVGIFNISLVNPSLQPFVQKTRTGNNFGEQYICRPTTNSTSIIIGVIFGLIILIVAIAVTCCVVRRQRRWSSSGAPYSRIEQVGV